MTKDFFLIKGLAGKKKLKGEIKVNGAKNAVLPAIASSVLFKDEVRFQNVPNINDVGMMLELISDLGGETERTSRSSLAINAAEMKKTEMDRTLSKRMRASIILSGPILSRFGKVAFPHPGGCVIGERPIDMFLEGFKKMGASAKEEDEKYILEAKGGKLKGAEIFFKIQTVTGTETFLMAAILAEGKTILKNCAMEPEIASLADFLVECGAKIKGAGTPVIEVEGGGFLEAKGISYKTIPDRIEAGSFLILGALAADELLISNCNPEHLESLVETMRGCGVKIEAGKTFLKITGNGKAKNSSFRSTNVKTHEYPGFPTDIQAPMAVFLTQVSGESAIFETIFENRLNYTQDLVKMGADIKLWDSLRATIKGPSDLRGKELDGPDIRAGLAYVIAAIIAKGDSVINNIHYIDRGYEKIEERLRKIGVEIERVTN